MLFRSLGSVYESLLELVPQLDLPARAFGFVGITDAGSTSGNARKTTGSYYTPDSLVQELIKSALDPVIAARLAAQPDRPIDALLSITVCDPSCGSGHFLLAAARRLAEKLAELRAPDGAVRPDDYRHALREVASRCLYGVDINPMAVELCRVALWLETVDPGKPLGFLDHHIRTGNSLLGTTPDLIAAGLPDDTFTAIEGDDKAACAELKKRNKKEREGFGPLFKREEDAQRERLRQAATALDDMDDSRADLRQQKEAAFHNAETAPDHRHAKLLADLWCAAFVVKKYYPEGTEAKSPPFTVSGLPTPIEGHLTQDELFGQSSPAVDLKPASKKQPRIANREQGPPTGITTAHLLNFVQSKSLHVDIQAEVDALARQYRFFHWHLAFPRVFAQGGFDCILGNPPWEMVEVSEKEFFAHRAPAIANASSTRRRQALLEELQESTPDVWREFSVARRISNGSRQFVQTSGAFPHSSVGRINLYPLFTESIAKRVGANGRVGIIVPSAISMDAYNASLFGWLLGEGRLVSLYDFENSGDLFANVHRSYRFCLLTIAGSEAIQGSISFCYFAHEVGELREPQRVIRLALTDIELFSPNTLAPPILKCVEDVFLAKLCYSKFGVFLNRRDQRLKEWVPAVQRMLSLSDKGDYFRRRDELPTPVPSEYLRLYSGKTIHGFTHRFATFQPDDWRQCRPEELRSSEFIPTTEYYALFHEVKSRTEGKFPSRWLIGYRDIARATDERTAIAAIIPRTGCDTHCRNIYLDYKNSVVAGCLVANINCFGFDYLARQKIIGTGMGAGVLEQLPVLPPSTYAQPCSWESIPSSPGPQPSTFRDWLFPRVIELTYTAWDLEAFAADCGWSGPPFRWDDERRFQLRCELDAAFFHLYLGSDHETTAPDGTIQPGWQQQPEALTRAFPTPRYAVSYIMDTFPIVKRKDEAKYGHYRTKETILGIYDALAEARQPGAAPFVSSLNPRPADILATHDPRLPALLRPSFSSADYFEYIVPLIARLQPEGVEVDRLLLALEILSESEPRRAVLKGQTGVWSQWAAGFPRNHAFSDAAAALIVLLQDDTLTRWQGRISAPPGVEFVENEWLNVDAFIALRLALAAPAAVIQQRRTEIVQRFPALAPLLIAV